MKRLLIGAAVLIALVLFGSMKHPHKHLVINSTPQDPVVTSAQQVTVGIRDFDFFPRELSIQAGAAVTWVNRDAASHDATDPAGSWATGALKQYQAITLAFDSPGVYQYHCTIHPNMQATLKVSDLAGGDKRASEAEVSPRHRGAVVARSRAQATIAPSSPDDAAPGPSL